MHPVHRLQIHQLCHLDYGPVVKSPWLVDSSAQADMQGATELHTTSFIVPLIPTLLEYVPHVPKNPCTGAKEKN